MLFVGCLAYVNIKADNFDTDVPLETHLVLWKLILQKDEVTGENVIENENLFPLTTTVGFYDLGTAGDYSIHYAFDHDTLVFRSMDTIESGDLTVIENFNKSKYTIECRMVPATAGPSWDSYCNVVNVL